MQSRKIKSTYPSLHGELLSSINSELASVDDQTSLSYRLLLPVLQVCTTQGWHVCTTQGWHVCTTQGWHVCTTQGWHVCTTQGWHVCTTQGWHVYTTQGWHLCTTQGWHVCMRHHNFCRCYFTEVCVNYCSADGTASKTKVVLTILRAILR